MLRHATLVPAVVLLAACSAAPPTDRLLVGGIVHAPAGARPAAVAILDGRIVAVIAPEDVRGWARRSREVIDLGGAHVFPGLSETHGHLLGYGAALEHVDLVGTAGYGEVIERVRAAAAARPPGTWIHGRGWDQNDWPEKSFPHHAALSAAVPDHPVALGRVDGHAMLTNAAGLAAAGISAATPDPSGGRILRDRAGEPTGILVDNAEELLEKAMPEPSSADLERRAVLACRRLAEVGLTEIHDAGTGREALAALRRLAAKGGLPIRVYVMLDGTDASLLEAEMAGAQEVSEEGWLTVRAVKLYADGALGSRGALLSAPYSDEPSTSGLAVTSAEELAAKVRWVGEAGFQPCIHAIGDLAVTRALDSFEHQLGPRAREVRARIEHAQNIRPEDVPRFARLGVIAAVQPTHCTSDMPWAPDRLGEDRVAWAYRWRSLLNAGARLALGSDVPVENPDPRLGLWAAVTRRTLEGIPPEGWNPLEALLPAEAVEGYTSWAAFAGFEEAWRGTIAPGFAADLTIVDRDLSRDAQSAVGAQILRTVVGGRDAYVAGGEAS